jgi:hypothetical protein
MRLALSAVAALVCLVAAAAPAHARCPHGGWPSSDACREVEAYLMPGVLGVSYFPKKAGGPWIGGGVQIVPLLWSHNTEKFGPGQGKLIFDVSLLDSTDDADSGSMLMWRLGAQLSFERNASRTLFIPFFGATFGGISHDTVADDAGFFLGSLGVHALFFKNVVLTLEGGYLFPFSQVDELAGWQANAAVNFTLW